jgi:uncharacterized protein (TIGR00369 family)
VDLAGHPGATPAPVAATPPGRAEALFGVGAARADAQGVRLEMRTGDWMRGPDGAPCAGSLGVFLDDLLGNALLAGCPAGYWPVSTELSADLGAPPPADGSLLTGRSQAVSLEPGGGLGQGTVTAGSGRAVASATARVRYLPAPRGLPAPLSPGRDQVVVASSALELLGAVAGCEAGRAELTVPGSADFENPMGNTHGGILLCAAEIAGSLALQGDGRPLRTASMRMIYVRPVPAGLPLRFTAQVLHRGRTLGTAQVTARAGGGKPCAHATITAHDERLPG